MRVSRSTLIATVSSLLLLTTPVLAQDLQNIFSLRSAAPGFENGSIVESLADAPSIDASGNVSIVAFVRRPDGTRVQALYRVVAGDVPRLVFRAGDIATGGDRPFIAFPFVPETPHIAGGALTFTGELEASDGTAVAGIWSDRSGSFERLFLASSDVLPDVPAGSPIVSFSMTARQATVLLRAQYARGSQIFRDDEGIWRNSDGIWRTVIAKGRPAPGISGAVFDGATPLGTIFFFTARPGSQLFVQAFAAGSGVTGENDEGLWLETPSGLQLLVREGSSAPMPASAGGKGKASLRKATFGPTTSGGTPTFGGDNENLTGAINASGQVVFGAVLRSNRERSNSVWTNRSGALELVALGTIGLVGSGPGAQAPGFPSGVTFGTFQLSRINSAGRIAFLGAANSGALNLTEALWWDVSGPVRLVAAIGQAVPGIPGASYADIVGVDRLTDTGSLLFEAFLAGSGIGASNNRAILRATASGAPQLRLRTGDVVQTPSGARTVRDFSWGDGITAAGRSVAGISFTDGTAGVFTLVL